MTRIALLYDSGPGVGMGHQRRMIALASALEIYDVETELRTFEDRDTAEITVVDSYRIRADEPGLVGAKVVVAVDDLDRCLAVDLLVDPNPMPPAGRAQSADRSLNGPRYALLDTEIAGYVTKPIVDEPETLLVVMGASDEAGFGAKLASRLAAQSLGWSIRLVVGPWGSQEVPRNVEGVRTTRGLIDELANADLVVTAAGVTLLEALCLGRPTLTLVTADNQRRSAQGAAAAGAALLSTFDDATTQVTGLWENDVLRRQLSFAARSYIDGMGASRVAKEIHEFF